VHIAFASHSADLLGAERSLVRLVAETASRGHQVTVVTPRPGRLGDVLAEAGAEVRIIPTRSWMGRRFNPLVGSVRLAQALASMPRYRRFLAQERPAVLVTNSAVLPAPGLAARGAGVPHVWLVRESVLTNPTLRSALPRRRLVRIIDRTSDRLVAVSAYVAGQVLEAAPGAAGKLAVIPPSVTALPRLARGSMADPLRRLLIVGRLSVEKGQEEAVAAVAACAARGSRMELTLAGLGSAAGVENARRLAARYGVAELVRCVEWVDDPGRLYAGADVTLMLSRNEAFGRVTVESLMTGTPVIGYRLGCTSELLSAGGGVLIEPGVGALVPALTDLASEPTRLARLRLEAAQRGDALRAQPDPARDVVDLIEALGIGRS
jgi:glycosyltransferase involved in cell wall biosynthesis